MHQPASFANAIPHNRRLSDIDPYAYPLALDIGRNFEVSTSTLLQQCFRSQERDGGCDLNFHAGRNAKVIVDDVVEKHKVPGCIVEGDLDGYDNLLRAERNLLDAKASF